MRQSQWVKSRRNDSHRYECLDQVQPPSAVHRSNRKAARDGSPDTRILVIGISAHSFSDDALLSGWAPDSRGVFTDALSCARQQHASDFAAKAAHLRPIAQQADIFGALSKLAVKFGAQGNDHTPKSIWIFSDMMNDTSHSSMPKLLPFGANEMLRRAESERLLMHLLNYQSRFSALQPRASRPGKGWPFVIFGCGTFWSMELV